MAFNQEGRHHPTGTTYQFTSCTFYVSSAAGRDDESKNKTQNQPATTQPLLFPPHTQAEPATGQPQLYHTHATSHEQPQIEGLPKFDEPEWAGLGAAVDSNFDCWLQQLPDFGTIAAGPSADPIQHLDPVPQALVMSAVEQFPTTSQQACVSFPILENLSSDADAPGSPDPHSGRADSALWTRIQDASDYDSSTNHHELRDRTYLQHDPQVAGGAERSDEGDDDGEEADGVDTNAANGNHTLIAPQNSLYPGSTIDTSAPVYFQKSLREDVGLPSPPPVSYDPSARKRKVPALDTPVPAHGDHSSNAPLCGHPSLSLTAPEDDLSCASPIRTPRPARTSASVLNFDDAHWDDLMGGPYDGTLQ